jgi:hypothetical protein
MEDLGREVALCLRYYSVTFRGHRPSKVKLLGGEAADPQLQAILSAALTIPVETGRPLYSVDTSKMKPTDRRGNMSEWAAALGLSLKFTKGRFKPRDGKPRDPNAPRSDLICTMGAEVIDLAKAMDPTAKPTAQPAGQIPATQQTAPAHASSQHHPTGQTGFRSHNGTEASHA